MSNKTFDPKCFELAVQFLDDHSTMKHRANALAADLQEFIEGWLADEKAAQRCHHSLTALADEPAEIECVAEKVLADIELLERSKQAMVLSRPDRFEPV